jgi:putative tryptophan/tyrosine transport system substrate-binding protein
MKIKAIFLIGVLFALGAGMYGNNCFKKDKDKVFVAIASYGPHSSLEAAIQGTKEALAEKGWIDHKNIYYEVTHVGFDSSLIPQMISSLAQKAPRVMVVMTTPVAQMAKNKVHDIPLVYSVITDPFSAGLIPLPDQGGSNITGSSERQNLEAMLDFVHILIPGACRVGLLYSSAESNDKALVSMMDQACKKAKMTLLAVPLEQGRDIPSRMETLKGKVDFLYVGTSGPVQPALPMIISKANSMGLPVINADSRAAKDQLVLASFGVNYEKVGKNAGYLVHEILKGSPVASLKPLYPAIQDHEGWISLKIAKKLGLVVPENLPDHIHVVEEAQEEKRINKA